MRVAGAATKAVLLQAAANAWDVPVAELKAQKSMIVHEASSKRAPFADFRDAAAELSLPAKPSLKTPDEYTIMGTDVQRFDVPPKVDGSAKFGIDATVCPE